MVAAVPEGVKAELVPLIAPYELIESELIDTEGMIRDGSARAVRTVDPVDGSYSWEIEILLDEIPDGAQFPIEVNVVASNLGKWEKVSGATDEASFNIIFDNT